LSEEIGHVFENFRHVPVWLLVFILSVVTSVFTQVTSNISTANIFLPIVARMVGMSAARRSV